MKKLFAIIAIAGSLVACNNAADSTAEVKDSIDSIASEKTEAIDSAAAAKTEAVDSLAEAAKDSVDKKDSASH